MASAAFGSKKKLAGKEFRHGTVAEADADLRSDIEEAMVTVEAVAAVNAADILAKVSTLQTLALTTGAINNNNSGTEDILLAASSGKVL